MDFKKILYSMLSIILVSVYTFIKHKFPMFPIEKDTFINFVVWVIGLALGGWSVHKFVAVKFNKIKKLRQIRNEYLKKH